MPTLKFARKVRSRRRSINLYGSLIIFSAVISSYHLYLNASKEHSIAQVSQVNTLSIPVVKKAESEMLKKETEPKIRQKRDTQRWYEVHADETRRYGIIFNAFQSEETAVRNDISLTTYLDSSRLASVINLANSWTGPMEVPVFITTVAMWNFTMHLIEDMRKCEPNVKRYASWHLTFPLVEDTFIDVLTYSLQPYQDCPKYFHRDLDQVVNKTVQFAEKFSTDEHISNYPATILSNMGYSSCKTEFFFHIDSDLTPSAGLRVKFLQFAKNLNLFAPARIPREGKRVDYGMKLRGREYKESTSSVIRRNGTGGICKNHVANQLPPPDVYIVPTFQTKGPRIPRKVSELKEQYKRGQSSAFYAGVFSPAYAPTTHAKWMLLADDGPIECGYEVQYSLHYEPFIIARLGVPKYDERFSGYAFVLSHQTAILAAAGYHFKVLKNAFLMHDGWKQAGHMTPQKKREVVEGMPAWRAFILETEKLYHPKI